MYVVLTTKGEKMDYKLLENAPLFKDVPPEEINVCSSVLAQRNGIMTKVRPSFMPEMSSTISDWCWPAGYRLKMMMSGAIKVLWKVWSRLCLCGKLCLSSRGTPYGIAIAAEPSHILFLDTGRVLTTCPSACTHHNRLIQNLLYIFPRKI